MRRLRFDRDGKVALPPRHLPETGELKLGRAEDNDIVLPDQAVSEHHAALLIDPHKVHLVDLGSKNRLIVDGERRREVMLEHEKPVQVGRIFVVLEEISTSDADIALRIDDLAADQAAADGRAFAATSETDDVLIESDAGPAQGLDLPAGMVAGTSPAMSRLMARARIAAASRLPVLLQGETGTGKELIARLLHRSGPAAAGPFVPVNCSEIPPEQLMAELVGVAKRAATNVDRREGRFVLADGGVLLLDEIADLPLERQPGLLRVLEEREVWPLGASKGRRVDVKVISACNCDLSERVEKQMFRRDLYHRLAAIRLDTPPLRERPEDMPDLIRSFVGAAAREAGLRISGVSGRALRLLLDHPWPGNVRQLKAAVELAVQSSGGGVLESRHLQGLAAPEPAPIAEAEGPRPLQERVADFERQQIEHDLAITGGNRTAAAKRLGITRQGLRAKMKRLGLS